MSTTDPGKTNGKPQQDDNNPEEVISDPEEVQESNDEKIDQDYPGYPHYPSKEDILDPENSGKRLDLDVENLTRSHTITSEHIKTIEGTPPVQTDFTQADDDGKDDLEIVPGTDADVTAEDLLILGARNEDMDMGEDEELKARGRQPRTGKDLDVPDAEQDENEAPGQEDEENSYYSLGGDEMQKLEESDDQNNF